MTRLLLHICCGPCATTVIERLLPKYHVTGYFSNPNLFPGEEHVRRLDAARTVCEKFGIGLMEDPPDRDIFLDTVRGLENEPENGERCRECYRLRLRKTMRAAVHGSFDLTATTLTVGPMKKASVINPVGADEAAKHGIRFLEADWKKNDGFRRSCELAREFGIYRQHYCGCEFSMRDGAYGPGGKKTDLSRP